LACQDQSVAATRRKSLTAEDAGDAEEEKSLTAEDAEHAKESNL